MKKMCALTAAFVALTVVFGLDGRPFDMKKARAASDAQALAAPPEIIDLHSDLLDKVFKAGSNISLFGGRSLQTGLPYLKQSGVKAQFFAIWEKPGQKISYSDILVRDFYAMLDKYYTDVGFAGSVSDMERNMAAGKISAFLGLEGADAIGQDLSMVDHFYKDGVRYITLTWNKSNTIADAAKDPYKPNKGLSPFGRKVVARMNELGILVDVSHTSDQTVRDVLAVSRDPIIASHSNAYAVYKHPRNLKDSLIREICECDGLIGVNYHKPFLTGASSASAVDVANHIDHIVKIGGIDCVALGSDFDGDITPPVGLENAGKVGNLTRELKKRGYSDEDIKKIYGDNAIRVMRRVLKEK